MMGTLNASQQLSVVQNVLDNVLYSIDIEYHDCYSEHGLFNKNKNTQHIK